MSIAVTVTAPASLATIRPGDGLTFVVTPDVLPDGLLATVTLADGSQEIAWNYDQATAGYNGTLVTDGTQRTYTISRKLGWPLGGISLAVAATSSSVFPITLLNPGAEAGTGYDGDHAGTVIPNWTTVTGAPSVLLWANTHGFPVSTDPGPPSRGLNYFFGGAANALSVITQTLSFTGYETLIDAGILNFALSAYLGGCPGQDDNAVVSLVWKNAGGATIGTTPQVGPVTNADRGGVNALLLRSTAGSVPPLARSVVVTLTMTRVSGSDNDGYADEISLRFSQAPATSARSWTVGPILPVVGALDYVAQAKSRVIIQYRESSKLLAFINVLMSVCQELENILQSIPPLDDPAIATGVNLDVTADLVGQSRQIGNGDTATDGELRILIGARITRNNARVSVPEYIEALFQFFQAPIDFTDNGHMSVTYGVGRVPSADEIALLDGDIVARPMGVRVDRFFFDSADYFGFLEDADSKGYGDTDTDPDGGGYATGF